MSVQKFLKLFFVLNYIQILSIAQSSIKYNGRLIPIKDTSYVYDYLSQELFYKNNSDRIRNTLFKSIDKIEFDHCHQNAIDLLIYVDTSGVASQTDILSGTKLHKVDSIICATTTALPGRWNVTDEKGRNVKSLFIIKLIFSSYTRNGKFETTVRDNSLQAEGHYPGLYEKTWSLSSQYSNDCIDDNAFYEDGIKQFNSGDYKKAVYSFLQALKANPNDIEAMHNLGVCYYKLEKNKKACEYFKHAADLGYEKSEKALLEYCNN